MPWFYTHNFDKKRLRAKLSLVGEYRPEVFVIWSRLCSNKGTDLDRLAMADILEEEGYRVESFCMRNYTACKPRKNQKNL